MANEQAAGTFPFREVAKRVPWRHDVDDRIGTSVWVDNGKPASQFFIYASLFQKTQVLSLILDAIHNQGVHTVLDMQIPIIVHKYILLCPMRS